MIQTYGSTFAGEGSAPYSAKVATEGVVAGGVDYEAADGTVTNHEIDIVIPITGLLGLMIWAEDQDMTVKTNSTSVPDDTWIVKAGCLGIIWTSDSPMANPVSVAITKIYVTKAGDGGVLRVRSLVTPP